MAVQTPRVSRSACRSSAAASPPPAHSAWPRPSQASAARNGPATAFGAASAGVASSGEWTDPGRSVQMPVPAARVSKFAPPEQDTREGRLGPQRIPGAGPHPGSYGTSSTGPIPAVGEEPVRPGWARSGQDADEPVSAGPPAAQAEPSPAAPGDHSGTGPTPVFGGRTGWSPEAWSTPAAQERPSPLFGPAAAERSEPTIAATGSDVPPQVVLGAPVAGLRAPGSTFRAQGDTPFGSTSNEVIVPPATLQGEENRLPIFEAVESDWFRRGRPSMDLGGSQADRAASQSWSSPGDEGWRAAEAAAAIAASFEAELVLLTVLPDTIALEQLEQMPQAARLFPSLMDRPPPARPPAPPPVAAGAAARSRGPPAASARPARA